jgi:sporulation protein YhbH
LALRIDQDHSRFKAIVRGKIKQNLRKYVQQGEMIGKKGKDFISIPVPFIDVPHFKYGSRGQGGVGQGEGQVGDAIGKGKEQPGEGGKKAGEGEGQHVLEVDVSLDELAAILGEELQLPNIEHRGSEKIITTKIKYTGISPTGPQSLRHFKRSFKQALKRQLTTGTYNPERPIIIPVREDLRYRTFKLQNLPETNAVIIYMMDVSGSMGDEQKEIVRIESFWLDTWLRNQYKGLESRYIIHDAVAREVDRDTFFHTRESGGTMISSAYKLARDMIKAEYPPSSWNIYPFHFSDGDNWSAEDTRQCIELLKGELLPWVNQFAYGQVESPYGSGQFIKDLRDQLSDHQKIALSEIPDKDGIYGSIKDFLGKGR